MPQDLNIKTSGLQAFREQVNIGLFNDVADFIMAATATDPYPVRRNLEETHLWYTQTFHGNIQDQYGFRYLGELLERFEDKAGSDIRDIRAIALAMAYTKDLFTDDMFVGNQKINFVKKITRQSADDVYLKGALYLLKKDKTDGRKLLRELSKTVYTRTEALIFVLSLYEDFEQGFITFKPQLISLLGAARTITAAGDAAIYCWLIKRLLCCARIKEMRTKDMPLFRALTELSAAFVKAGSRHYSVLLNNGYSAEEIIFLNSFIVRRQLTRNTMKENSITAEKIAVEMGKTFINSENLQPPEIYEHLEWALKKYHSFRIKISGWRGIYQAIENDIKIENPQTFLWLFKRIEPRDVFRFDILDEKWDILSLELSSEDYRNLFDAQLEHDTSLTGSQMQERIHKYEALTESSYWSLFEHEYYYAKNIVFRLLVEKSVIDLVTVFNSCPGIDAIAANDKDKPPILQYIGSFIKGVRNREAFDFFRYFLQTYNFDDMHRLFTDGPDNWGHWRTDYFFADELYKGPVKYHRDDKPRFDSKRPFLSEDEHRELFGWLDDYMLQYKADQYIEFTVLMLLDPFVTTLFSKDELRRIYDMVRGSDVSAAKQNADKLSRKYLSEAELQAEHDAEKARADERQRQVREQQTQALKEELTGLYDGTFESLLKYLDKHKYNIRGDGEISVRIAAECLGVTLKGKNYVLNGEELGRFLQFSGKLLKAGVVRFACIKEHILKTEEEAADAENNGTREPYPDA